jgi:thiamine pyrophosphate-dependent acetolactate synthase large subunit-like protein
MVAAELATHFGAAVATTNTDHRGISIKHPQHMGGFESASYAYNPDLVISLGVRHQGSGNSTDFAPFRRVGRNGGRHLALGSDLEYLTNYPGLELGSVGDEKDAVRRMLTVASADYPSSRYDERRGTTLDQATKWRESRRNAMMPPAQQGKVRPGVLVDAIDEGLEDLGGGYVTNEQFAASHEAVRPGLSDRTNVYLRAGGGSEGWGVGAAIGAKLAAGDDPVVGFVGDGSLYYADSGLWTAVHHNIPVLYVITNNGAYGIVAGFFGEAGGQMSDTGKYGGVVLDGMDPVKIADAFGMEGERVEDESDLNDVVRRGMGIVNDENRPYLLDIRLPLGLPEGGEAAKQYLMR